MDNNIKRLITYIAIILASLFLIKALDLSYPLSITTTTRSSELSVIGEGKVDATPNLANVNAGITVDGSNVSEVQSKLDKINNAILQEVQKLGIKKEDIATSNYSINPNYNYDDNVERISGYNGTVTISVKVRDTKAVSRVLNTATKAGANQIHGVRFEIEDPSKLREEARNKAIQNAREQAQKLARILGIRLGKVVNIVESSGGGPVPLMQRMTADSVGIGGEPVVEPGTQTVTSTVTLFFEKK